MLLGSVAANLERPVVLAMPFTRSEFLAVFGEYNTTLWPAPVVAVALAVAMMVALRRPAGPRWIGLGLAGQRYPEFPTFGLPCPTTIFTFGLMMWTVRPVARSVLVIPVLWAVIGASAAMQLGIAEDWGLPLAAAIVVAHRIRQARRELGAIVSVRSV